ncbi:MAG TPA: arylesterase [Gemmatimonadales bacterium]|nr:arylesterase [Gemmatimonadales bacterium]
MIATFRGHAVPLLLAAVAAAGCGGEAPRPAARPAGTNHAADEVDTRRTLVFLGTSLTAGYGLDPDQAYPALIQAKIDSAGLPFRVVNAGVSGETSAGARRRIEWLLARPVDVLVVETGANDMLRGLEPDSLRANLRAILDAARHQSPPPQLVLLAMEALPNYGARYTARFREVYREVARETGAVLVPFFLEGVAGVPELNQPDGLHPTAEGQRRMAANLWTALEPVLRRLTDNA